MSEPLLLGPPPAENEPSLFVESGTGGNGPQNSTVSKISGAVGGVFEKFGIPWKPGRGRPRKDGAPKKSDKPLGAAADVPPLENHQTPPPLGTPPAGSTSQPFTDEIFAAKCLEGIVKGYLDFRYHGILGLAVRVSQDMTWSKARISEIRPSDDEIKTFVQNVITLLKKWNVPLTYLPEISVLFDLVRWEMRNMAFVRELRMKLDQIEKQMKAQQAAKVTPMPGGAA